MFATTNLITTPIFTVTRDDGERARLTLPALLAGLSDGSVAALTAVAAHQRQSLFRFLVQLAGIALSRQGVHHTAPLPPDEATWAAWLRQLTPAYPDDEPWSLVVEDITRPAFMQPAILAPEGLAPYKKTLETPDVLDVLILAKGHDVKPARPRPDDAELWLYALISLQTTQGFLGVGNQGISRMNGGFGSRCFVSRAPGPEIAERFVRDVRMLLHQRSRILDEHGYMPNNGLTLVWLQPWDTDTGILREQLDPFFVEICRRIRLVPQSDATLAALFRTSGQPRIDAKASKGNLGDPWIPINSDNAALTVSGEGFTTKLKCDILFGKDSIMKRTYSLERVPGIDDTTPMLFIGSVLVRGQGKTEGLHEFTIPVPPIVRDRMADATDDLSTRSEQMLTQANTMRLRVLRPALLTLLQGGSDDLNFKDDQDRDWRDRFTDEVDRIFFDELWTYAQATSDEDRHAAYIGWITQLRKAGEQILARAMHALPIPAARRVRAEAQAETLFAGAFYKQFGSELSTSSNEEHAA